MTRAPSSSSFPSGSLAERAWASQSRSDRPHGEADAVLQICTEQRRSTPCELEADRSEQNDEPIEHEAEPIEHEAAFTRHEVNRRDPRRRSLFIDSPPRGHALLLPELASPRVEVACSLRVLRDAGALARCVGEVHAPRRLSCPTRLFVKLRGARRTGGDGCGPRRPSCTPPAARLSASPA